MLSDLLQSVLDWFNEAFQFVLENVLKIVISQVAVLAAGIWSVAYELAGVIVTIQTHFIIAFINLLPFADVSYADVRYINDALYIFDPIIPVDLIIRLPAIYQEWEIFLFFMRIIIRFIRHVINVYSTTKLVILSLWK